MPKVSGREIYAEFQFQYFNYSEFFFKNKLIFMKKVVLHTTTLMHCKARQVFRDLFITNQGNGSKMTFVAGTNKVHMKNLKT